MKSLLVLSAFWIAAAHCQSENVTITLFATDLSGCDTLSKCDAFVKIFCQSKQSDWRLCGQTSAKQDDNFPVWPETFTFPYTPGNRDQWRFNLIDEDVAANDPIAQVDLTMEEYVNATDVQNAYASTLQGDRGTLYVQRIR